MNILLISQDFPYPPVSGDRIRNYNLIKVLSRRHRIHLISFEGHCQQEEHVAEMKKFCASVKTVPLEKCNRFQRILRFARTVLSGQPQHNCFWVFQKAMADAITQAIKGNQFDIIQIEHSHMAPYVRNIPAGGKLKKVLTLHNIGFVQYRRIFQFEKKLRMKARFLHSWLTSRRWEPAYSMNFDKCVTMSEIDKRILHSANPGLDIDVVPNGVDLGFYKMVPAKPGRNSILFVGILDYAPNADAVLYFSKEIFPRIAAQNPGMDFYVIGRNPTQQIRQLAGNPGIKVVCHAADLRPYYERCFAAVVPLRSGGGTRLKILEAMAMGMPVVTTSVGCEGIDVTDGENILIADSPGEFASNVIKIFSDRNRQVMIGAAARRLVEARYSWEKIGGHLENIYSGLLERP
ncbi:MAG: glycosyltransferase [Actinomycetota bacterium]|nr:glycosyltransferase [Actinomycetota bacterium]